MKNVRPATVTPTRGAADWQLTRYEQRSHILRHSIGEVHKRGARVDDDALRRGRIISWRSGGGCRRRDAEAVDVDAVVRIYARRNGDNAGFDPGGGVVGHGRDAAQGYDAAGGFGGGAADGGGAVEG